MTEHHYDLGFLDIECERCGARDCPLYPASEPGEWLCDGCVDGGKDRQPAGSDEVEF